MLRLIQKGTDYRTLMDNGPSADRERRERDLGWLIDTGLAVEVDTGRNSDPARIAPPAPTRFGPTINISLASLKESARNNPPAPARERPRPATAARLARPAARATRHHDATANKPLIATIGVAGAVLLACAAWWMLLEDEQPPAPVQGAATPAPDVATTAPPVPDIVTTTPPVPANVTSTPREIRSTTG
ncbi:MAG: hypothetical protein IPM02_17335 [Betaproteobacteria bacterium]|nr:hypothetical protein [Betaproteobacteria bacterium]